MNASNPLASPESPLQMQWREDRALRQRVRLSQSWRGCMGMTVLLDPSVLPQSHGDRLLVPNSALTWVALRDVPVGHWHFESSRTPREVNYASSAVADLHHGMPRIDFSQQARNAVDFRLRPFGRLQWQRDDGTARQVVARGDVLNADDHPRLFEVLNRISQAMTTNAFAAVTDQGSPLRPAWFARRPAKQCQYPSLAPRDWFPRPYLGFNQAMDKLLPSAIPGQVFRLSKRPDRIYFPAYVVARDVRNVPPVDLVWDIAPAQPYFDPKLGAAVFPPLRQRAWNHLRWCLAEVDLNAGIGDPRVQALQPAQRSSDVAARALSLDRRRMASTAPSLLAG